MAALDHLDPIAQSVLGQGDEARVEFIRLDHWVEYESANRHLTQFEAILSAPKVIRPPCFILLGSTQIGKTSLLREFARRHPFCRGAGQFGITTPVVYALAPRRPDESQLEESILGGFESRFHPKNAQQRREIVSKAIVNGELKVLLVDEVQQSFKGTSSRNEDVLEFYKDYSNRFGISIVVAGTPEAYLPFHRRNQLSNRFRPLFLHHWKKGREVLQFIAAYERLLPLKQPSCLTTSEIALYLVEWMEGMLGELVDLLREAAIQAVLTGEEKITLPLLESLSLLKPSHRKGAAEAYARASGLVFPDEVQRG